MWYVTLHGTVSDRFYFGSYQSHMVVVYLKFNSNLILFLRNELKYSMELTVVYSLYLKHSLQMWKLKIIYMNGAPFHVFMLFSWAFPFLWFLRTSPEPNLLPCSFKYLTYVIFIKIKIIFFNVCTVHLYIIFIKNLCNLAKYKFFKFCEDDAEVSKHVGVNII